MMLVVIVGFVFIGWYLLQNEQRVMPFYKVFEFFTGGFIGLISSDLSFSDAGLLMSVDSVERGIVVPELLFPFLISFIPLLYIYVKKYMLNLLILILLFFFYIVRSAFITILFFSEASKDYQVLLNLLDTIRYIPFYLIILYVVLNNSFLKSAYQKIKVKFDEVLSFDINILILLLMLNSVPRVIITFINPEILNTISNFILQISQNTFSLFGVETFVNNSTILVAENWIYLGHGCLGLGLLTMVIVLILATKSPIINKLSFIFLLFPVQIILNSLRVDLLIIYYHKHWDLTIQPMDMHDYSNVFIYSLGFGMFLLYYFWYQEVKFGQKSTIK